MSAPPDPPLIVSVPTTPSSVPVVSLKEAVLLPTFTVSLPALVLIVVSAMVPVMVKVSSPLPRSTVSASILAYVIPALDKFKPVNWLLVRSPVRAVDSPLESTKTVSVAPTSPCSVNAAVSVPSLPSLLAVGVAVLPMRIVLAPPEPVESVVAAEVPVTATLSAPLPSTTSSVSIPV